MWTKERRGGEHWRWGQVTYYSLEDTDTCGVAQGGSSEVLEFSSHKTDWTLPGLNIIKFWPLPGFWGASVWPRIAAIWSHNKEVTEPRLKRRVMGVFGVMALGTCLRSCCHMDGTGPRKGLRRRLYLTPKWKGVISESLIDQGSSTLLATFDSWDWAEWKGRNQYLQRWCWWCAECYIK